MQELDELLEGVELDAPIALLTGGPTSVDDLLESLTADTGVRPEDSIDRDAIYALQNSELTPGSDEDTAEVLPDTPDEPEPAVIAVTKTKGSKTAGKGKKGSIRASNAEVTNAPAIETPEAPQDPESLVIATTPGTRSEVLAKKANLADLEALGVDPAIIMEAMNSAPVKVQEKAYNLLRFVLGRENLSNYTKAAIQLLWLKDDGFTVPELVKAFEGGTVYNRPYNTATARSQAQQMSRLFGIYGMVTRQDGRMVLDRSHPFVKVVLVKLEKITG